MDDTGCGSDGSDDVKSNMGWYGRTAVQEESTVVVAGGDATPIVYVLLFVIVMTESITDEPELMKGIR